MKKEHMQVLHDEIIKLELSKLYKTGVISGFLCVLLTSPFVIAVFYFLGLKKLELAELLTLILSLMVSSFCVAFLIGTIWYVKKSIDISRGKFKVVTDTLVNAADHMDNAVNYLSSRSYGCTFSLHFCKYKPFRFNSRVVFYKWSEAYKMDGYSLLNSSAPGDKFYIVTLGSKTPQMVYNAKMFDYKAEQEQDL